MWINAVFEGGGVKGIALAGAVSAVQDLGIQFNRVAGTSSGSIVAACLAAGYTGEELKKLIIQTPFHSFLKRSRIYDIRLIGPLLRILLKKGLYSGEALEYWIQTILADKKIRTFGDLEPGKLRIIASDISQGKLLVLPDDIEQYGIHPNHFSVAKAVRMSCSIPFFFDPVMIRKSIKKLAPEDKQKGQYIYIVDGGLLSNFPLWLFDPDNRKANFIPTIGFQLVGANTHRMNRITDPISMLQALFSTMMGAHDQRFIEKHNFFRTVKIPTLGVQTTDFHISKEKSMELYQAGYDAAHKYFSGWSKQAYLSDYKRYVLKQEAVVSATNSRQHLL